MRIVKGDPLTAIILAVLCHSRADKTLRVSRADFEKIPKGLTLELHSDASEVTVKLVRITDG